MLDNETPLTIRAPVGVRKGGVVVLQEAFGVNAHIVDVCHRIAEEGWLTVAPHLFHRTGEPPLAYDDFAAVRPHMSKLTVDTIDADLDAAFGHLTENGIGLANCAIVGFCMGGTVALAASARRELGAGVTFYGGGVAKSRFGYAPLIELAPGLRTPWLGLFGDRDKSIPTGDVEALRKAAATAPVPTGVVRYPEAGHGFNCDLRASYHEPSATDAWSRMLEWFNTYAARRP